MPCAIVMHSDGRKTHHTNVVECGLTRSRQSVSVRLQLTDGSVERITTGVSVMQVDDLWFSHHQLGGGDSLSRQCGGSKCMIKPTT